MSADDGGDELSRRRGPAAEAARQQRLTDERFEAGADNMRAILAKLRGPEVEQKAKENTQRRWNEEHGYNFFRCLGVAGAAMVNGTRPEVETVKVKVRPSLLVELARINYQISVGELAEAPAALRALADKIEEGV